MNVMANTHMVPVWSPPGRRETVSLAISIVDELAALFEAQDGTKGAGFNAGPQVVTEHGGTQRPSNQSDDAGRVIGQLRGIRADLEREAERTAEAEIPYWFREKHLKDRSALHNAVIFEKIATIETVKKFFAQGDVRQAGLYALAFARRPLELFRERIG